MTTKIGAFQVPFHPDGEMYERNMPASFNLPVEWKQNYTFKDTMKIETSSLGRPKRVPRSTACNLVSQTDGKHYVMFMSDLVFMLQHADVDHGIVRGDWTFVRHGTGYGIALI